MYQPGEWPQPAHQLDQMRMKACGVNININDAA